MGILKTTPRPFFRRRSVQAGAAVVVLAAMGVGFYVRHELAVEWRRTLANQALDRLDLVAGADYLRKYLDSRPDDAEVRFLLASTLRRDGKLHEAKQQLDEARRLGWDPDAVRREADLLALQSSVGDRSTDSLLAMVGSSRPDRDLLETLYRGDLASGNWDRAALWLHLWLESYPDDWQPRLWQAEIFARFRKYDRARADYRRVLEVRPGLPQALLGTGQAALASRADYTEAETYLGRYLAIDPGHLEARLGMALCRYGRGDLSGAREKAQGVLNENPSHPGAALLLGSLEAEAGRTEEAIRWLKVAEAGGADPQGVSYQLAQVLRRAGQAAEAERYEQRFTRLRDAEHALEAATRAAEREPKSAERRYAVGKIYLGLGQADLAAQWFQKVLALDPAHRASHAALADYYAHQLDPRAAARAEFHRRQAQNGSAGGFQGQKR